jgi:hypothetical protein
VPLVLLTIMASKYPKMNKESNVGKRKLVALMIPQKL